MLAGGRGLRHALQSSWIPRPNQDSWLLLFFCAYLSLKSVLSSELIPSLSINPSPVTKLLSLRMGSLNWDSLHQNSEDPAPGYYSLELFLIGTDSYMVLWNRSSSEIYWSSGYWNGKIFSLVPEMRLNYIFNYSFVSNENEIYFTYDVYDNYSTISRLVIDVTGQIKQQNWLGNGWMLFWSQPREQCDVYAYCGAYGSCNDRSLPFCNCLTGFEPKSQSNWDMSDYSDGCQRKTELQCQHSGKRDRFTTNPGMVSGNEKSVKASNSAECESTCLNDCSCTAYAYENNNCLIWIGDLFNLKQVPADDSRGMTLYVRLAASESSPNKIVINVVASAGAFALLLGLIKFIVLRWRKMTVGSGKAMEGSLVVFEYGYLQNATKNFSEKLGGGGFGSVFKGTLPGSTAIAVKQLESVSQGEKQFRAEVSTIGTIQHVNLVRLHGFCSQGSKKLLVYNYMPNGSLDSHLFETKNSKVLNWETRYQIALGTARGLCYLHEECRECIIHCDIKPDNILLDAEFCPKVADFGLAKLVGRDFSRVLTTIRGTRGYLAPEWISGVAITAKADVYSFGMMLFEIISGRRNSKYHVEGEVSFFPIWAASIIIEGGDVFSLLDPRLEGNADPERLIRVCRLACWCIHYEETQRPSMGQIVQILEGLINVNLPPLPRLFQAFVDNPDEIISSTESSSSAESSQAGNGMSTASSRVKSNESSSLLMS
nr:G-type lectin S-receptor-like serine/threonine-protein kinase At2g19130 isoform X3 [Ziziphus jujuba var. spinosa]